MATANHANNNSAASKKSGTLTGYSLRKRARTRLNAASKEATPTRIAAAAGIGAAAALAGFLSSASRREQLSKGAHDLKERWLPEQKAQASGGATPAAGI